jgi:hypothetical protein
MKPPAKTRISKARTEGVSVLLEEIRLAIEWNRPSILLAVQKNNRAGGKAEAALEKEIRAMMQQVVRMALCEQVSEFPRLLIQTPATSDRIFFIRHLDCDQRDRDIVYRLLNLYRETFVECNIRAVFWLTPQEATNLMRIAPDFWAFRHRVIELAPERNLKKSIRRGNGIPHGRNRLIV